MVIKEFYPLSQQKVLRSKADINKLPDDKKIIIYPFDTTRDKEQEVK